MLKMLRAATSMAVALSIAVTFTGTAPAAPEPVSSKQALAKSRNSHGPRGTVLDQRAPSTRPITSAAAGPTAAESAALARLNSFRSMAGLPAVGWAPAPQGLLDHARYLALNISDPSLNWYAEEKSNGRTAAGAAIAPYVESIATSASYSSAVDLLMQDPGSQFFGLLDPSVRTISFARHGQVVSIHFPISTTVPKVTYPLVMPSQGLFPLRTMSGMISPWYTSGCSATSSNWGFPITVQYDPNLYGTTRVTSHSVKVDGRAVSTCVASDTKNLGTLGQIVIIPTSPVPTGSHVAVSVTANLHKLSGTGADTVTKSFEYATQGSANNSGDQTGDGVADVLAVDKDGNLRLYKGRAPGHLGHSWQVGHGWGEFTWMSRIADITGDGVPDLVGRRGDGHIYLYTGRSMGFYHSGRQIGRNWNGLRELAVIGDTNGDKLPEIVGIITAGPDAGRLARYTLTSSGITGKTLIGRGWAGVTMVTEIGDFDGNGTGDFLGVNDKGLLYAYYTANGVVSRSVQVGRGWNGWTALFSPGDLNKDGRADLMGRNAQGTLYSWEGRNGSLTSARVAGTNWNGIRLFG